MLFPYMLRRMRRQPLPFLLLFLLNLAVAIALSMLFRGAVALEKEIDDVYAHSAVVCRVSSLNGSQTEALSLPPWVISLFMGEEALPPSAPSEITDVPLAETFRSYLSDAHCRVSAMCLWKHVPFRLTAITDVAADSRLSTEHGNSFMFFPGYGLSDLFENPHYCLLPRTAAYDPEEDGPISIGFEAGLDEPVFYDFIPIGTHIAGGNLIYCSWDSGMQIIEPLGLPLRAEALWAELQDARTSLHFRQNIAPSFFVEPNPEGTRTPWKDAPVPAQFFPYALLISDDFLQITVSKLNQNLSLFRLCTLALLVVTLVLGAISSWSIVRHRIKALALQQIMGLSRRRTFAETWCELALSAAIGTLLGALGCAPPPGFFPLLLIALLCSVVSAALVLFVVLRKNLIQSLKEDS